MGAVAENATLIATLTRQPSAAELASLPPEIDVLEVRADLIGDLPPEGLKDRSGKRLLYTLRSGVEGGAGESGPALRQARLLAAARAGYDLIDLEAERDLDPHLQDRIAPEKRILSWHGAASDTATLARRFSEMAGTSAWLYKLVPAAAQHGEELAPLALLGELGRRDVAAFASGPIGAWTRLIAPRLGAPVIYGAASEVPGASGQLSVEALIRDYGLPRISPVERCFGLIGNPVSHSLSPRLHNGAYRELGIPALYLPFHTESFADFWLEIVESELLPVLGVHLLGFSVTAPHKDAALAVAEEISPLAERIGAANTLLLGPGGWRAESSDPAGLLGPLAARGIELAGRGVAVVGAGGAGRSVVVGLLEAGARVTFVNRSSGRGRRAAGELGVDFVPLELFVPGAFEIVINATAVGRDPDAPLPFAVEALAPGARLVDLVYGETPTPLVVAARARGLEAIDGREVLLFQGQEQFRRMTGRELPTELGRRLLDLQEESR